ncbi:MAG TPA: hypothetical protein ENK04_04040 [Gammaproteobacteria bacterium]|nr:hypothetical protein [Gammaproteobacteria bacterium]
MKIKRNNIFAIPEREALSTYLVISLLLSILFVLVYGGMNWLNAARDTHYHWYMDWELSAPLIPGMVYVYLSLEILFLLPLFTMTGIELKQLGKQMAAAILVSGTLFFLFPTETGYVRQPGLTAGNPGFDLIYLLDKPHNLFPSLHISLSALIIAGVFYKGGMLWRSFLGLWLTLLTASVILTHQHHLLDIVGGFLVFWFVSRMIPLFTKT